VLTGRGAGLLKPKTLYKESLRTPVPVTASSPAGNDLMTDEEVCDWLKVNKQWLSDHRTRVEPIIPHFRLGREIRYSRKDISAWLNSVREARPKWERNKSAKGSADQE
jgi:hypothetical protein